jgi:LuxR family maltose regulon positive regulatory protein
MLGNIAAMRAYVAVVTGDFSHAIELANLASETLSERNLWARSVFQWALGYAHRMRGDLTGAGQAFAQVVRLGRATDNVWTTVTGMTDLAMVHRVRGRFRQAADLYREALQLATERGVRNLGYMGRVEAGLAGVLYEQNDLAAARRYAADSIEKTQWWKNPNHFVFSYNVLARVLQAQGDFQDALETLQKADQVRREFPVVPALTSMIDKSRVRLWLAQGDPSTGSGQGTAAAERWAQENRVGESETFDQSPEEEELLLITLARVLIAQRKVDEALRLLNRLGENAEAKGRIGILIEILVLQAMALRAKGDNVHALSVLEKGLALTEPEGYARVFVDEGAPMAELLRQAASRGVAPGYASRLLAAFPVSSVRGPSPLVEPLTKREIEVLRLVAQGASNRAIAESLVVTTGTIKTHVSRIMGKLGARNRTEAVARARELDML